MGRGKIELCRRAVPLHLRRNAMSLEFEAVYENGVLKPREPLPLREHERVVISVKPKSSRIRQAFGLIRWTGDPEDLRRIAEGPECSISESP